MFPKADPSSFQMYFEAGLNSRDSLSMQRDAANLRAKNRMTIEAYLCDEHEKIRDEDKKKLALLRIRMFLEVIF